jgi:3-deoxy-D-manno-octulosonic-acid transferase
MKSVYNLFISFYALSAKLSAIKSEKARKFIKGRKNWISNLKSILNGKSNIIWFHVASLGEFEQALPVIELIHKNHEDKEILLTFFSPSGFDHAKLPDYLKLKVYLPMDTASNAQKFLDLVKPELIVFVKYDIWYHYLNEAKKRKIPSVLISALFRKDQIYFKSYGKLMNSSLKSFDKIFVQNETSLKVLKDNDIQAEITGDTRYDRVKNRLEGLKINSVIKAFKSDQKILLLGSSWKDDLDVIIPVVNKLRDYKVIVAPHNVGINDVNYIDSILKLRCMRYSEIKSEHDVIDQKALIIDNIGMLATLYASAEIAYVGGAFHGSLHNILEPAVFGIPIIFGPKHTKFPEAQEMIDYGCAFSIKDTKEFETVFESLIIEENRISTGKLSSEFIDSKLGSANKIYEQIQGYLSK